MAIVLLPPDLCKINGEGSVAGTVVDFPTSPTVLTSHSEEILELPPCYNEMAALSLRLIHGYRTVLIEYPPRHSTIHIRPSSSFRQLIPPPPPPAEKGTPPRDIRPPPICYLFTCLGFIPAVSFTEGGGRRDTGHRFSRTFQPLF